jgi:hypothetical protein
MLRGVAFILCLGTLSAWSQTSTPDTPAGRTLRAFLDAFNSGDRARMEAYLRQFDPGKPLDALVGLRGQTGGFELLGVEKSEPRHIEFRVKEKSGRGMTAIGRLDVKDGDPAQVESLRIRAIPPGTTTADLKIDAATRDRVIDGAAAMLDEYYVYPEVAKKMVEALRTHRKQGDYDSITDGEAFAEALTKDLREVSHDKHLRVNFSMAVLPRDGAQRPSDDGQMRKRLESTNCGFEKAEVLPRNIGYLKFNMFADPAICGTTAVAAMNFLGNVDAIIFDLRENGGGEPAMIALISTYLFGEPTHLNDLYDRKENSTTQYWTLPFVEGKRLTGKPVFVLTAHRTFSGAEEFSYNLKNLKRATIIGETTGGGAHPVSGHRIDDHFMIGVPFARAVNPISKTNWEGTGVEPDVKVPAGEALDVARKMAAEQIAKKQ